jgi:hypothetical protein
MHVVSGTCGFNVETRRVLASKTYQSSLLSGTALAAAWKPIFECVPSQNGF